jgi:hypothetical protein
LVSRIYTIVNSIMIIPVTRKAVIVFGIKQTNDFSPAIAASQNYISDFDKRSKKNIFKYTFPI